jgi:hypothetical protein
MKPLASAIADLTADDTRGIPRKRRKGARKWLLKRGELGNSRLIR